MAFLKKYNDIYYIGWQERVYFEPSMPPLARIGKFKGQVTKSAQKAMEEGRNYIYESKWQSTNTTDKVLAEKLLKRKEAELLLEDTHQANDLSFLEAVSLAYPVISGYTSFYRSESYILRDFKDRFGKKYLSSITAQDLRIYVSELNVQGVSQSTAKRRLGVLRTIYREALSSGKYEGQNPFTNFKGHKFSFNVRVVTLDDADQKKLLKACYDPELTLLFLKQPIKQGMVRSLPIDKLIKLGYDPKDEKNILEHLYNQVNYCKLPPATLKDIVTLTLFYGLRRGESIGVGLRSKSGVVKTGGLRVKHWDADTKRLYVTRTKQMSERKKVTEIQVVPVIADILNRHCQGKAPDDLIFTMPDGSPIQDVTRPFNEAVKFAGIKLKEVGAKGEEHEQVMQYRDTRHCAANNMIEAGLPLEEVAYYLGHTSTAMLQQVYYTRRKSSQLEAHSAIIERGMNKVLGIAPIRQN